MSVQFINTKPSYLKTKSSKYSHCMLSGILAISMSGNRDWNVVKLITNVIACHSTYYRCWCSPVNTINDWPVWKLTIVSVCPALWGNAQKNQKNMTASATTMSKIMLMGTKRGSDRLSCLPFAVPEVYQKTHYLYITSSISLMYS